MKLWILRPSDNLVFSTAEDNPWLTPYEKVIGFVIRANTEQEARTYAHHAALCENGLDNDAWLNPELSTCRHESDNGHEGLIDSFCIDGVLNGCGPCKIKEQEILDCVEVIDSYNDTNDEYGIKLDRVKEVLTATGTPYQKRVTLALAIMKLSQEELFSKKEVKL
jgi:hypothetical protein